MMKNVGIALIVFIMVGGLISVNGNYWTKFTGPYGGAVSGMIQINDRLFAYNTNGIFYSDDEGSHWLPVSLDSLKASISCMTDDNLGNLYIGTGKHSILKSTDKGTSWEVINDTGRFKTPVFIFKSSKSILFSDSSGYIIKSSDDGKSWSNAHIAQPDSNLCTALFETSDGNLYGALKTGKVIISENNGDTWSLTDTTVNFGTIKQIVSNSDGYYYVATSHGFYRSNDNGKTYSLFNSSQVMNNACVIKFIDDTTIFVGTTIGTYISYDNGNSWTTIDLNSEIIGINSICRMASGKIVCGTILYGIYSTTDLGNSWERTSEGYDNLYFTKILPVTKERFLAGTNNRLPFLTTDFGKTWTIAIKGQTPSAMAISPWNTVFLGSGMGGVFRSVDLGDSFTQIYSNYNRGITTFYFRGEQEIYGVNGSIAYSPDNGDNWQYLTYANQPKKVNSIAWDNTGGFYCLSPDTGLFMKNITDTSWTLLPGVSVTLKPKILVNDSKGDLFIAADSAGLFVSYDNGYSFSNILDTRKIITVKFNRFGHMLVVTSVGDVYTSIDRGQNWKKYPNEFAGQTVTDGDFSFDNFIMLTSSNGIYLSSEATYIEENTNRAFPDDFKIFPVPSDGIINVVPESCEIGYSVEIIDNNGQMVVDFEKLSGENALDLNCLSNGFYFAVIKSNNSIRKVQKVIIIK